LPLKHLSDEELDHDFLWRTTACLPERGRVGIFNRSYYEEVLIVRVHPEILSSRRLPDQLSDPKTIWRDRYRSITEFEAHLHRSGTKVVKFFLHMSKDEQRRKRIAVNPQEARKRTRGTPVIERQSLVLPGAVVTMAAWVDFV